MNFPIEYYKDYLSAPLAEFLLASAKPVKGASSLFEVGHGGEPENSASLCFLRDLYLKLEQPLNKILTQRKKDRQFIDERVKALHDYNRKMRHEFETPDYETVIGLEDGDGRIVFGPLNPDYCNSKKSNLVAPIPEFLKGPHVTLFGPPGTAKMAINAMNSFHRKIKDEPEIVSTILKNSTQTPKWGADDEDSKTPLREDLVSSSDNLNKCYLGTLNYVDESSAKKYSLAEKNLAVPIKRFPGLALPCTFLFFERRPVPLHLYDFALHLFSNWNRPEALVFYVPKLENEEEARYIKLMIETAEKMIVDLHPEYKVGTVRLMIVLENPRAILRTHEIMDELYPYFAGASLGWHDYLASTARLFKEDSNYRIPVKADPDIVIKYIKASHNLLADVVGARGGIKVGGMYGILPIDNELHSPSFQATLIGYIRDVVTQLKRNLDGFWVAHPDFVRLGIALVEAWREYKAGNRQVLTELIKALLLPEHQNEILKFIDKPDIEGLSKSSPSYVRSLIVADIKESDFIPNNHPSEIRYNVFQFLQYVTDWLSGNGCVALPAHIRGTSVRVMDDLATAERSRWEVWHEIRHGRFSVDEFLKIAFEELHFIRKNLSTSEKQVQVKWTDENSKWYPIAFQLMVQLMCSKNPPEFATELLMPFTIESIRGLANPLEELMKIDPEKYKLDPYIQRYIQHFEICGSQRYAKEMSRGLMTDLNLSENLIKSFTKNEILEASHFHGDIGHTKSGLDSFAQKEQSIVAGEEESKKALLRDLGTDYEKKFGIKFLISARGKNSEELLNALKKRLNSNEEAEIQNAREALWQISLKRYKEKSERNLFEKIKQLQAEFLVHDLSLSVSQNYHSQSIDFSISEAALSSGTFRDRASNYVSTGSAKKYFQLASLSKPISAALALEFFQQRRISLDTPVNELLEKHQSPFKIEHPQWSEKVTLRRLLDHSALNMHYVNGFKESLPPTLDLLTKPKENNYRPINVLFEPGSKFQYSGGGFILLEHILEIVSKKTIQQIADEFFKTCSIPHLSFYQPDPKMHTYAQGYFDNGEKVAGGGLLFPKCAAGAYGTSAGVLTFLELLSKAHQNEQTNGGISHSTALEMTYGLDRGCQEFMASLMGLGIFVAECGDNKVVLHQGANEGFRALFFYVVSGPNAGDGFVLLCNADNKGVHFLASVAKEILLELRIEGFDFDKLSGDFDYKNIPQEQIVNLGYKKLLFGAMQPTLPEKIRRFGTLKDELSNHNLVVDSKIVRVSNQRFARAENLISPYLPTFDPSLFGRQGKIMDSWESARHNLTECDFVELELKNKKPINYVSISTEFHDGNQAEFVRIVGHKINQDEWIEIVPKLKMEGHSQRKIKLPNSSDKFDFIRIEMYPDGGLTRIGLFEALPNNSIKDFVELKDSVCKRFSSEIPKTKKPMNLKFKLVESSFHKKHTGSTGRTNLLSAAMGAKVIKATNEHYGPAAQVISPYPPINMFDGLESARSRKPGHHEELVVQMALAASIKEIVFDFTYFVNNSPEEIEVFGLTQKDEWICLIPKRNVKPFAGNRWIAKIENAPTVSQIKFKTIPDGGINRIEAYS